MNKAGGILRGAIAGILGTVALLSVYFLILTAISGWAFTLDQFYASWYFIVGLAVGFGIQIGLYTYSGGLSIGAMARARSLPYPERRQQPP